MTPKVIKFWPYFGLAVTLTFNLLTSKSNQFTFVPNCTEVMNLVKFPVAVCNILLTDIHNTITDTGTNRKPSACVSSLSETCVSENKCRYNYYVAYTISLSCSDASASTHVTERVFNVIDVDIIHDLFVGVASHRSERVDGQQ